MAILDLPHLTLIIGGARSGKSRHAEQLMAGLPPPWIYIATGQAFDDEMRERIAEHQRRRSDDWRTIEAPIDLAAALAQTPELPVLVDCLTLWLTNLMLGEHDLPAAISALETTLGQRRAPTLLVSNEVGMGIVPEKPLGRRFRDEAGRLNQRMAAKAGCVLLMVAGIPMTVK
ncbi:MAG: cobinamide kinase / cobinamide phosphate guanyltransferase family protein [Rhodospirillales bacterium]|nr:cobinamide kinase / cobinamide phosphate guanyltransferase family protein [Rhodospirillales bacterium]